MASSSYPLGAPLSIPPRHTVSTPAPEEPIAPGSPTFRSNTAHHSPPSPTRNGFASIPNYARPFFQSSTTLGTGEDPLAANRFSQARTEESWNPNFASPLERLSKGHEEYVPGGIFDGYENESAAGHNPSSGGYVLQAPINGQSSLAYASGSSHPTDTGARGSYPTASTYSSVPPAQRSDVALGEAESPTSTSDGGATVVQRRSEDPDRQRNELHEPNKGELAKAGMIGAIGVGTGIAAKQYLAHQSNYPSSWKHVEMEDKHHFYHRAVRKEWWQVFKVDS